MSFATVSSNTFHDQSIEIDLSKQPNGIYFIKVEMEKWNERRIRISNLKGFKIPQGENSLG